MIYLTLFLEFFKTGLFAIGGGLATIPFLYKMAEHYPWFSASMLGDMIAVSESTPGPIGINMATYAGFQGGGILGGAVATFSLVLPSVVIIIFVYKILERFKTNQLVQNAFYGIRPAVTGMIASTGLGMMQMALMNAEALESGAFAEALQYKSILLFVVLLILTNIKKWKLHPIFYIVLAGAIGILFRL